MGRIFVYMSFRFTKQEKLRSEKLITRLFQRGNPAIASGPFRMSYILLALPQGSRCQVLIAASKKNFKTAVSRNRIKRQLRELYRINKGNLAKIAEANNLWIALLISYSTRQELVYKEAEPAFVQGLNRISHEIEKAAATAVPAADQDL